jgi:hypothetical protein
MFTNKLSLTMRLERLKKPTTIWSIIVFVFTLGGTYFSINARINALEEFKQEADILELKTSIVAIQKDVERIKLNMPIK